ncbi:MAG: hydrogenase [Candidatus Omnitrophica bacterium CG11_big_fil_rev_8_21_14_0_20_64_10]|nr:MAG: hydrogenase [Candidatus Omnitrophica bacterium CG11_big_fil_rev_8_21_14_0_20_64_10]
MIGLSCRLLVHVAVVLLAPPLLLGVIGKTKAFLTGRIGPPILQPYYDLWKLWHKGAVYSRTTSWLFRAGPMVALAAFLVAALLIPLGSQPAPLSFFGDVILWAYLFGLARFATVLAAMDTGSSFEGMGASREVTFSSLAEPALFLGLAVVARQTQSLSLSQMLGPALAHAWAVSAPALGLVAASLFIVLLAENARIPVDDPATHLELTMIHEVMVLDHGGPDLGLILYGSALKLFVLGMLLVQLFLPGMPWVGLLVLCLLIGAVESLMARLRLVHVPRLLMAACALAAMGLLLVWS